MTKLTHSCHVLHVKLKTIARAHREIQRRRTDLRRAMYLRGHALMIEKLERRLEKAEANVAKLEFEFVVHTVELFDVDIEDLRRRQ